MENVGLFSEQTAEPDLLTPDEEINLAHKAILGDQEARDQLVLANLRLVRFCAKRYNRYAEIPWEDLVQEATVGLIEACRRFEPDRGNCLSTYAAPSIRSAVIDAIMRQRRTIRLPASAWDKIWHLQRIRTDLVQKLAKENPSIEELAESTGFSTEMVTGLILLENQTVSFDKVRTDPDDKNPTSLQETLMDETDLLGHVTQKNRGKRIRELVDEANLTSREKEAIELTIFRNLTLEEAGEVMRNLETGEKISRNRTHQIRKQGLDKIKRMIMADPDRWNDFDLPLGQLCEEDTPSRPTGRARGRPKKAAAI